MFHSCMNEWSYLVLRAISGTSLRGRPKHKHRIVLSGVSSANSKIHCWHRVTQVFTQSLKGCTTPLPLPLPSLSPPSPLHLPCLSPPSPLPLPSISPPSPLPLPSRGFSMYEPKLYMALVWTTWSQTTAQSSEAYFEMKPKSQLVISHHLHIDTHRMAYCTCWTGTGVSNLNPNDFKTVRNILMLWSLPKSESMISVSKVWLSPPTSWYAVVILWLDDVWRFHRFDEPRE